MRLLSLCAGWVLGIFAASRADPPALAVAVGIPIVACAAVVLRRYRRPLLFTLLLAGLLAGMLRFEAHQDSDGRTALASYNGVREIAVRGTVGSFPEEARAGVRFNLSATEVTIDGASHRVAGQTQVTFRPTREMVSEGSPPYVLPGDALVIAGRLEYPQAYSGFDFPAYLAQQGVGSVMDFPRVLLHEPGGPSLKRGSFVVRTRLARSLDRVLPEPENALARSLALGDRSLLPQDVREAFAASGTTHILAISGLNIGIVMAGAWALARRFGRGPRMLWFLAPVAVVWGYALMAGLPPSAHRAAVMASFYLAAMYLGRERHGPEALFLAAAAITAVTPQALWQISFHLSFLAMAGVILSLPWAEQLLSGARKSPSLGDRALRWILASIVVSLAATAFTLPAVAFYFHRVSVVGVVATVFMLPVLPIALVSIFLTAFAGLVWLPLAWVSGSIAWLCLSLLLWTADVMASLPFAVIGVGRLARGAVAVWSAGLLALAWTLWAWRWTPVRFSDRPSLALTGLRMPRQSTLLALCLAAACAVVWTSAAWPVQRTLDLTFLDVGHGDAILIRTPSKHVLLVDGGPDPIALIKQVGHRMPMGSRRIDLAVLTHTDQDHVGGLPALFDRYHVQQALSSGTAAESASYVAWAEALRRDRVPLTIAQAGQKLRAGGVEIEVLHPPQPRLLGTDRDDNNNSVVLRVRYGNVSFLLTGDIESVAERYLVGQDANLGSTVLKIAHHGSATSTTQEFLDLVSPSIAIITADRQDTFGHPSPQTMASLERRLPRQAIFSTADRGAIRLRTDGTRLWVSTER